MSPTESTPGNPATLPAGAAINAADLDFTGLMMPPPGSGVPPLSEDEKMLFARWIDLGCPIDWDQSAYGWFLDDLRPALDVSLPLFRPELVLCATIVVMLFVVGRSLCAQDLDDAGIARALKAGVDDKFDSWVGECRAEATRADRRAAARLGRTVFQQNPNR